MNLKNLKNLDRDGCDKAMVQALNTVAHIALDRWQRPRGVASRAALFGATHLLIAIGLGWALTGSFVLAGAYAFIEPLANTIAHAGFERWWRSPRKAVLAGSFGRATR